MIRYDDGHSGKIALHNRLTQYNTTYLQDNVPMNMGGIQIKVLAALPFLMPANEVSGKVMLSEVCVSHSV